MKNKNVIISLIITALGSIFLTWSFLGDSANKVVETYCIAPYSERLKLRNAVNKKVAPNSILIQCIGDELREKHINNELSIEEKIEHKKIS